VRLRLPELASSSIGTQLSAASTTSHLDSDGHVQNQEQEALSENQHQTLSPNNASTRSDEVNFNLLVVSPSVGVPSPLPFPQLSAWTTVKQLKEKIRGSLPRQPADDHQRLIHRGRLLAREDETMLEIFGQEKVRRSRNTL
jgi:hypothetical protein